MAGQLINLTRSIVTFTPTVATFATQPGKDALDVSGYPGLRFDFALKVYVMNGAMPPPPPDVTVSLHTSMYNDDNSENWTPLGSFDPVYGSDKMKTLSVDSGVLRYIKWHIVFNAVNLVSFEILGVGW